MTTELVTNPAWLEPLAPSPMTEPVLAKATDVIFLAGKLQGLLAPETGRRLGALLRLTSSYYSNLIEGQYTEPKDLEASVRVRRTPEQLTELAIAHIEAERAMLRLIHIFKRETPWDLFFSPETVSRVHRRLFQSVRPAQLVLPDGSILVPGQLRGEARKNVSVGDHDAPDFSAVEPMLKRMRQAYGRVADPRMRLLVALAYHHRLAWVHPFPDGNGRVVRMITQLQLSQLGLTSSLWSLSRGLARRQDDYYAYLANAEAPRRGDLDGRGQLTQAGLIEFIEFMLDVCLDQMTYMQKAFDIGTLRERLERIVAFEPRLVKAGVKLEAARALHILINQGQVQRSDFKVYLGLGERVATDQLKCLIDLGLVESPTPKSRVVYPCFPVWFAQLLFPDLHRRFQ